MANAKKFRMRLASTHEPVTFYAGPKIVSALEDLVVNGDQAIASKMIQVVTAVYEQGLKDGRKDIIIQLDQIKAKANYLPPGRPKKRTRR